MFREIKKRKIILENRKPYIKETLDLIDEINRVDWVYSSLKLDGSALTRDSVGKILKGSFLVDVSVREHGIISNLNAVIDFVANMAEMNFYLNEKYMFKLYNILINESDNEYRKTNPILRMIEYNPPHFKEVAQQMELLFYWLHSAEHQTNPIEKAAYLHNKIIEIYPYHSNSEAMARIAAQYHLMINGFPPVLWNIGEQEYYDALRLYLRKEDVGPIYDVLERGVYNKLELMMQLTANG